MIVHKMSKLRNIRYLNKKRNNSEKNVKIKNE